MIMITWFNATDMDAEVPVDIFYYVHKHICLKN